MTSLTDKRANRPYHIAISRDESEDGVIGWVARVAELPGCLAQGRTAGEAADRIQDAMEVYIADLVASCESVPEPAPEPECNGRILARVPRTLHERLLFEAGHEGVSLNQFIVGALAASVGWRTPPG